MQVRNLSEDQKKLIELLNLAISFNNLSKFKRFLRIPLNFLINKINYIVNLPFPMGQPNFVGK